LNSHDTGTEVAVVSGQEQRLLALIEDLDAFSQRFKSTSKLNIFEAVGLRRQEIKHSNFLAFLLRPLEQHGLGDAFLRRLISKVIDNLQVAAPISPLTLALASFEDAIVTREWRGIDLVVESKVNRLVLIIENKVDASEGANQLSRYENIVKTSFPEHRRMFAYLTPEGDPPSSSTWSCISYTDVIDALATAKPGELSKEAHLVIDHYIDMIRRNLVPDQELVEQCRRLYLKHREALDLIYRYGEINAFESAANSFFKEHPEFRWTAVKPRRAVFLPQAIFEVAPEMEGLNWFGQSRPILFWLYLGEDNKFGFSSRSVPLVIKSTKENHLYDCFSTISGATQKFTRNTRASIRNTLGLLMSRLPMQRSFT
jgi:hypothetical protein